MSPEDYKNLCKEICLDDEDALDFLINLSKVFRFADDLFDGDYEFFSEEFDSLMTTLLFEFSRNEFYKKNRDALEAHIFVSWNAWQASNHFSKNGNRFEKIYAWFLRDYCFEIEHLVAWLVGGYKHAKTMNLKIRSLAIRQLLENGDFQF